MSYCSRGGFWSKVLDVLQTVLFDQKEELLFIRERWVWRSFRTNEIYSSLLGVYSSWIISERKKKKKNLYNKAEQFGFSQLQQRLFHLQSLNKQLGLVPAQPRLLACKDFVLGEIIPHFSISFQLVLVPESLWFMWIPAFPEDPMHIFPVHWFCGWDTGQYTQLVPLAWLGDSCSHKPLFQLPQAAWN